MKSDTYYLKIKGQSEHNADDIAIPFQSVNKKNGVIPASGDEVYAVLEAIKNPKQSSLGDTVDKFKTK